MDSTPRPSPSTPRAANFDSTLLENAAPNTSPHTCVSEASICEVTCTDHAAVTRLDASHGQLTSLPSKVTALTLLTRLNLAHNQLATLPDSIKELRLLDWLDLSHNELTGLPDCLAALRSLTTLNLAHNRLDRLPKGVRLLGRLSWLDVSHNQLASLPSLPAWLTSVSWLELGHNLLEQLPPWLASASSLQHLGVAHNPLSPGYRLGAPDGSRRSSVRRLDVRSCGLQTCLPEGLEELTTELHELRLGNLQHPLPRDPLANCMLEVPASVLHPSLRELDLRHLSLSGLPRTLSTLSQLQVLLLRGNCLGWLPADFSVLSSLHTLDVSSCELLQLPRDLGVLPLLSLSAAHNKLSSLPASLSALSGLAHLDLYDNLLEEVPGEALRLPDLSQLDLGYNRCDPRLQLAGPELAHYLELQDTLRLALPDSEPPRLDQTRPQEEGVEEEEEPGDPEEAWENYPGSEEEGEEESSEEPVRPAAPHTSDPEDCENWEEDGEPQCNSGGEDSDFDPFESTKPRLAELGSVCEQLGALPCSTASTRLRRQDWHASRAPRRRALPTYIEDGQFDDAET